MYYFVKKWISISRNNKELQRKRRILIRAFIQHIFLYSFLFLFVYSLLLYSIFFIFEPHKHIQEELHFQNRVTNTQTLRNVPLSTYFPNSKTPIQPINVVLISNFSIEKIFSDMGWIENISFHDKSISLRDFIKLFKAKELPVSVLTYM